jgi:SOS-response transcriptional repressors (RecA-mediated autopeptidases)
MNRIKLLRLNHNLTQEELCKVINISQASLSGYENGKYEPDNKTLIQLAAYFDVSIDYLLGYDTVHKDFSAKTIPVFRSVASDFEDESPDEILKYEEISRSMAENGEHIGIQMLGDSMEPRIQDGDTVIIRRQKAIENGDIAALLIGKNTVTLKKVYQHSDGIILIPYNSKYNPLEYTNAEMEKLPITILGKAVELRGKC